MAKETDPTRKTVKAFYDKHGQKGFDRIAERAETRTSYLRQLMYANGGKTPSLKMALAIVRASDGEISIEGLAEPAT